MFTSFDEKAFWKAIDEKDYLRLKINTVSSMLNDPTFTRGETKEVLKILKERVPDIFEDEVRLDYEERLEPNKWDKRYFTKLTYWFQENFALSRVEYIKEVGKVVHKDREQKYNASINQHPIQPEKSASTQSKPTTASYQVSNAQQKVRLVNPTKAPTAKKQNVPVKKIAAAAVVVLVVIFAVVVLVKRLDKVKLVTNIPTGKQVNTVQTTQISET